MRFRGVPFNLVSTDRSGGRSGPLHVYPFSEKAPFKEDTGLVGRVFTVEGFVVGAEYIAQRDALITALETRGPGELVHPLHGNRTVAVERFTVRDGKAGAATFSITFAETSAPAQPSVVVDAVAAVRASASASKVFVAAEFLNAYNRFAFFRDSATSALRSASLAVNKVVGQVGMEAAKVAALKAGADRLVSSASALLNTPENLVSSLVGLVNDLGEALVGSTTTNPASKLLSLWSVKLGDEPIPYTPNSVVELSNFVALQRLWRRTVLVRATALAAEQSFDTFEAAMGMRETLLSRFDELSEESSAESEGPLEQIRTDLVRAVPGAVDLPAIVTYVPTVTVPSLYLAHRLYGDTRSELDIVRRNRIAHPGFVTGGIPIQVLSRG